ncbi:MAG: VOC family protein [Burkholderiaceae bacterium]
MADPKRTGALAAHSVVKFVFTVPNLDEAAHFYTAFGLDVRRDDDRLDLYTFGHDHCWGCVYESGKPKQLAYLTLGVYAEDYDAFKAKVVSEGYAPIDPHPLGDAEGFWLQDPEGVHVQVRVAPKVTPNARAEGHGFRFKDNPIGVPIGPMRCEMQTVRPSRLSHILLFTSDVDRSLNFYCGVLGLRLSDRSGDGIAFTHGAHTSDHHLLAFAKSDGPGLHHTSWTVHHFDDVGLGMEQMRAAGYTEGWGVGRHVIGSNYFYYARDPWGSFAEFSYDIDFIDAATEWPAADYPPEDSLNLWGPAVPDFFIANHETAARLAQQ